MPEGPEIKRSADRLTLALVGKRAVEVRFFVDRLAPFEEVLTGRKIMSVEARGKAMLIRFGGGVYLYSHNQLFGRWDVLPVGRAPNPRRQLRVVICTEQYCAILYSATSIQVLRSHEIETHPYLAKLGPDALSAATTVSGIVARLRDRRFSHRTLAALLLDQSFVAGIGNYLRSEILFVARLRPKDRPVDIDAAALRRVAEAIIEITRRAYEHRGVTIDPAQLAAYEHNGVSFRSYRHWVFGRAGKPCHVCGTPVNRIELNRSVFYCPKCQSDL